METAKQHTNGERTALTLEELSEFKGSIIRQKQPISIAIQYYHAPLDIRHNTGISCLGCYRKYLAKEHGLRGGRDVHGYTERFKEWFTLPHETMFVILNFFDISKHPYECGNENEIMRNDFSMSFMVDNHENTTAYNGYKDWNSKYPIVSPQFLQLAFGTKRRNTQVNNKNLFSIFEVIEAHELTQMA